MQGEVQLSCVHVFLSKEMSVFRSTKIPPHRFHPIRLHPGWHRHCKEYLLFVFSITIIAKVFVVVYVIRLNLRVSLSGFGSISSPRFGNSGIYDLIGDSCSRSLTTSQIQYRTSLFLFWMYSTYVHAIMGQSEVAGQVTRVQGSRYSGQSRREVDGGSVVKL